MSRAPLRVLVAGGGVAALEAALALRHLAQERVAVELVAPEPLFFYRPLAVAGPFGAAPVHGLELAQLAGDCGAGFTLDAVAAVEPGARLVRTRHGAELEYDRLLVSTGARPVAAIPGALAFRGQVDAEAFAAVLAELEAGGVRRLVFALPGGVAWPLPLYELALQTAQWLERRGVEGVEITLVTGEHAPLGLFGGPASSAVAELLARRGIALRTGAHPVAAAGGRLSLAPGGGILADRVVSVPRLEGVPIPGIPHDRQGFVPVDPWGRVRGVADVLAAGDVTAFPVKQGGLAAQQADVAAAVIAAAGADVRPRPFRPVLRGLLLTGGAPEFLRAELGGGRGETSEAGREALWWPPGKIVGRHLAPFLAERAGLVLAAPDTESVPVDVAVDLDLGAARSPRAKLGSR